MARVHRQRAALRSLQELQVPREVGRQIRRRHQQGRHAQAHHRGRETPRGRRSVEPAASRRAAPNTRRSPSNAASPTTPNSSNGPTRSGDFGAGLGAEVSLKDFRKDIIIEVYNEAGQLAIAYKVYRCWVSEYPGAARSRRQRQRGGDPAHQAGERGLGARRRRFPNRRSPASPVRRPDPPCAAPTAIEALGVWERGQGQNQAERGLALLALAQTACARPRTCRYQHRRARCRTRGAARGDVRRADRWLRRTARQCGETMEFDFDADAILRANGPRRRLCRCAWTAMS